MNSNGVWHTTICCSITLIQFYYHASDCRVQSSNRPRNPEMSKCSVSPTTSGPDIYSTYRTWMLSTLVVPLWPNWVSPVTQLAFKDVLMLPCACGCCFSPTRTWMMDVSQRRKGVLFAWRSTKPKSFCGSCLASEPLNSYHTISSPVMGICRLE